MQEVARSCSETKIDHCLFENKQRQFSKPDRSVDRDIARVCIQFLLYGEEEKEIEFDYNEHNLFDKEHFASCVSCTCAIMMAGWFSKF